MPKTRIKKKSIGKRRMRKTKARSKRRILHVKKILLNRKPQKRKKKKEENPDVIFDSTIGKTNALFIDNPKQNILSKAPFNLQLDPAIEEALKEFDALPETQSQVETKKEIQLEAPKRYLKEILPIDNFNNADNRNLLSEKQKKSFWKKLFLFKNHFFSILIGLIFAGIFCTGVYVLATTIVQPGSSTPPAGCTPDNCIVAPPLTDGFTTNFSGTGNITGGAIKGTSFIIGASTISSFTNLSSLANLSNAAGVLTNNGTGGLSWAASSGSLPSQTGNNGKFLTTNGSALSWASALASATAGLTLPSISGKNGDFLTTDGSALSWASSAWTEVSTPTPGGYILYPTNSTDRVLIGGAADDTTSALQVNGNLKITSGNYLYADTLQAPTYGNPINVHAPLDMQNWAISDTTNITPSTDAASNIGSAILRYNNVYAVNYYGNGSNLTGVAAGTGASDQLAVWSGTNTLSGSADLTYDGTTLTAGTGATYFTVLATGNVGVGTAIPAQEFSVGAASQFTVDSSGNVVSTSITLTPEAQSTGTAGQLYYDSGNNNLYVCSSAGGCTIGAGWVDLNTSSSLRYKHNVQPLTDNWSLILQVQPKSFVYNGQPDTATNIGYIAEDFDALGLKDLVQYDSQGRPNGIDYQKITLYDTEILKQQEIDINAIKQQIGMSASNVAVNPAGTVGSGSVLGINDQSVKSSLANLGVTLVSGIMSLKQVIVDSITVQTARINKIEMVAPNGDIYCTWIDANGDWQKVKGDCASAAAIAAAPAPAPAISPEAQAVIDAAKQAAQQVQQAAQQVQQATQQTALQAQQAAQQVQQAALQAQQAAQQVQQVAQQLQSQILNISSVAPISDINVDYGTALASANLPATITATLSDATTQPVSITWDQGTPTYDPNTAGTYVFSGTLTFSGNLTNTNNLKAAVSVIVAPQPAPTPPAPAPAEQQPSTPGSSDLIQQSASGLLNGIGEFIKWLFATPVKKISTLPVIQGTAGLLEAIKNLFGFK